MGFRANRTNLTDAWRGTPLDLPPENPGDVEPRFAGLKESAPFRLMAFRQRLSYARPGLVLPRPDAAKIGGLRYDELLDLKLAGVAAAELGIAAWGASTTRRGRREAARVGWAILAMAAAALGASRYPYRDEDFQFAFATLGLLLLPAGITALRWSGRGLHLGLGAIGQTISMWRLQLELRLDPARAKKLLLQALIRAEIALFAISAAALLGLMAYRHLPGPTQATLRRVRGAQAVVARVIPNPKTAFVGKPWIGLAAALGLAGAVSAGMGASARANRRNAGSLLAKMEEDLDAILRLLDDDALVEKLQKGIV